MESGECRIMITFGPWKHHLSLIVYHSSLLLLPRLADFIRSASLNALQRYKIFQYPASFLRLWNIADGRMVFFWLAKILFPLSGKVASAQRKQENAPPRARKYFLALTLFNLCGGAYWHGLHGLHGLWGKGISVRVKSVPEIMGLGERIVQRAH